MPAQFHVLAIQTKVGVPGIPPSSVMRNNKLKTERKASTHIVRVFVEAKLDEVLEGFTPLWPR